MTDKELEGIAAQAFNLAKLDIERDRFNFLAAVYHQEHGLYRMRKLEDLIVKKLGEHWLNNGDAKNTGFSMLRLAADLMPPEAIVFGMACNKFEATEKLSALPAEEQRRLVGTNHKEHHRLVRQGYLSLEDALMCCAQTPQRICIYTRAMVPGAGYDARAEVQFFDQDHFDGNMKMFGKSDARGETKQ